MAPVTAPTGTTDRRWWAMEAASVLEALDVSAIEGLDDDQVAERLARFGSNLLEEPPARSPVVMFLAQFANTMILVLLGAAAITVWLEELTDAIVITGIVVLNAVIGFVQEYRAERAMEALRQMAAPSARVLRAGTQVVVAARDLVPGDILLLESGDIVPADARLFACPNLRVDESPLTGESAPVDKTDRVLPESAGEMMAERQNLVFKGTSVVYGRARGVVVATGMQTALGQIAGLLTARPSPTTPLQRRLAGLGRRMAAAALVVCAIVFAVGLARGEGPALMFLVAVSLAVAAIPEALPAVVTVALALGAQRMARQHALIRKLPAVEALGSVTVICTDKTGTLTEGRMIVERIWTMDGEVQVGGAGFEPEGAVTVAGAPATFDPAHPVTRLADAAVLCNDAVLVAPQDDDEAWSVLGDPTEGALLSLAGKLGVEAERRADTTPRVSEVPFDSQRKLMTTVHSVETGGLLIASKGAVESVLAAATRVALAGADTTLTRQHAEALAAQAEQYAEDGYRVLALAERRVGELDGHAEQDLVVLGLVAMADPPRPESKAAVEACATAGISTVMITGDHPATARAIGARLGIVDGRSVMTGAQLAAEHASGLVTHVDRIGAYARATPEQKLDIVSAWKARGEIVAMTGDGVNDAPALHAADIGVAMGKVGTEVAKEAADMVLTDDHFATIVAAVEEGRRIYDNIRRFVRYMLTSNSGEIWVMLIGPFLGFPVPLLPVQILWINLVTDGLPAIALGVEPAERRVMQRPPRPPSESIFAHGLGAHVVLVGLLMGAIPLALGVWAGATGRPWQTMVFASLALLQPGHAMAVRSETESLVSLGLGSNKPMAGAFLLTVLLQIGVLYWAPAANLLGVEPLGGLELAVTLVASTAVFAAVEVEKALRRRRLGERTPPKGHKSLPV
jgi:Ca2+-transporting ATPase